MADEIKVLSQFRADVREASPQARARAWNAVLAAAAEEAGPDPVRPRPHIRRRDRVRARPSVALAAALTAVAAVVTVALSSGGRPARTAGAFTTTWQAGRPASRAATLAGSGEPHGKLQLVSYLEEPQWKEGGKQVPPGYLDCPAVNACYVLAQTVLTTVGPYPNYYNSVYFSGDGGATWSSLALPAGLEFTAPLSCPSAMVCAGVGYQGDKNELVSTSDGGHQWLVRPLRAPADVLSLSCSTISACNLVTQTTYLGPGHSQQFASTTDAGASWHVHDFPSNLHISSFSCPSSSACIAISSASVDGPTPKAVVTVALVTTDGGLSWTRSSVPGIPPVVTQSGEPETLSVLSCVSRSNCFVFGGSTYVTSLRGLKQLPLQCPPTGCALPEGVTWHGAIATTADGGRHWEQHDTSRLYLGSYSWNYTPGEPGAAARFSSTSGAAGFDLSCPATSECWLSGPGPIGLLHTTDGGSNWSRARLGGQFGLTQVSCPQPGQCIALGAPNATVLNHQTLEYSDAVPVYSSMATGR